MFNLDQTPYSIDSSSESQIRARIEGIEERVVLLRRSGTLTDETIRHYYGEKRFEQVAESNAIEGSTLSAGETELAVLKGITVTGHDPAYIKDAVALDRALHRLTELAKDKTSPTNITQIHEIHALLLGDRAGAGLFRNERVMISGSQHTPPRTWREVMVQMEQWEIWSRDNGTLPPPIRAAVLHAWLAHIHPYIDGNGRTSRAISNLELIRGGYPPIIIKKKERDRYIEALSESDTGGDIRPFFELIFDRIEGSLTGLELSAKSKQGYDPVIAKLRVKQERQLKIWETSVQLLAEVVEHRLSIMLENANGVCSIRMYESVLDLQDYIDICAGRSVPQSWSFTIRIALPGVKQVDKLAYVGHRSSQMYNAQWQEGGPSLYWSSRNPGGYPTWLSDGETSPYAIELSTEPGNGDRWFARRLNNTIETISTSDLGFKIASALMDGALE